jgi:hypothetical protein
MYSLSAGWEKKVTDTIVCPSLESNEALPHGQYSKDTMNLPQVCYRYTIGAYLAYSRLGLRP